MSATGTSSGSADNLPHVLVVDDDPAVLEALCDELEDRYKVTAVHDGATALSCVRQRRFDAIISDVRMPGMSGVELVRRVYTADPEIVRILLTAYSDDAALEAAWVRDGVYKLAKPWGVELDIVLRRGLEHRRRLREAKEEIDGERQARERAELTISQLDKMASLGTLAAGVAHEMRAPLTYLRANFDWMERELGRIKEQFRDLATALFAEDMERATAYAAVEQDKDALLMQNPVGEIQTAASECTLGIQRLVEILENLRDYASPRKRQDKPVDLEHCIDQAIKLVACKYSHDVEFILDIQDDSCLVIGNEGELSQVLVNLLVNGIQAMEERGEIRVRVCREDERVLIEVEDQGPGVPADVVPRLFETFFTTKGETEGTGLGLSISTQIARRHRGTLSYVDREGVGAVFVLDLPNVSGNAEQPGDEAEQDSSDSNNGNPASSKPQP